MNARWTVSLAACTAVLLWGALRATAAEAEAWPNPAGDARLAGDHPELDADGHDGP